MGSVNYEYRRGIVRCIHVEQDKIVVDLGGLRVERTDPAGPGAQPHPDTQNYLAAFSADQVHELVSKLNQALLDLERQEPRLEASSDSRLGFE